MDKRRQLARQHSNDPRIRLRSASVWPIVGALVPDTLWTGGLGQLVFARKMPDGQVACAVFLVDVYCLGVKNALWKVLPSAEYQSLLDQLEAHGRLEEVSPESFVKLVEGAVEYAQSFGIPPHSDFHHARLLLSGVDPQLSSETFAYGKDGKPFYIRGPHESVEKAHSISQRIQAAGGHFLMMHGPSGIGALEYDGEPDKEWEEASDDVD